jgi:hypothetical protein
MKISTSTLLIMLSINMFAQNDNEEILIPFLKIGEYGFKNEKNATTTFCQTDNCPEFAIIEAFDGTNVFDKMSGFIL